MGGYPKSTNKPVPFSHALVVAELSRARPTTFDITADAAVRSEISAELGLVDLSALRFKGEVQPRARDCWRIDGRLTADLNQPCVVTLAPVPEKLDERVMREFVPEGHAPKADQIDLDVDADDDPDVFTDMIDPGRVALEALALALDPYPRAPGAEHESRSFTAPGIEPLSDKDLKPFAGLAALKSRMTEGDP